MEYTSNDFRINEGDYKYKVHFQGCFYKWKREAYRLICIDSFSSWYISDNLLN